jgi:pyoverdine/dityrosine biosynthesis protein Dit1
VSKQCKELAYRMIQRSRAWGDLVGDVFPDSLRLSIHPQHSHAGKIGFHLVRTRDNWLTPWHGVVVDDGTSVTLVKRSQAEHAKASLVWRHGRPSHYVNPNTVNPPAAGPHPVTTPALPEEHAS